MDRRTLPIFELESRIVSELRERNRLILQAPTGSGKSTQVPQILLDHGLLANGECVILQPRRLPTRMLAARVAHERGTELGREVGYQIRLDRVASRDTKIRFVTEGVLLRQMLTDPELRGVSTLIFDEFHERHLYGDISLARALDLQETIRPDLRIIVMSATLDTAHLDAYMAPAVTLDSSGRTFPVEMEYLSKPVRLDEYPIWDLAADELDRLAKRTEGDVLIFMPGAYEISRTVQAVRALRHDFIVLPLHGELPPADQDAAVARYEKRKVVVSTNVAETSLTIDGVRVVIDSGLAKIARFDPHRGINTLLMDRISRASAEQRAGRAGRTAPGHCLRLWTEREHLERSARELPEVRRLDLAEVVLTLKASGVDDISRFRWLEAPDSKALDRAESLLHDLGALHPVTGAITETGRRMLAFPLHPRYARMLLAASEKRCVRPIALVAALTQGRPLLRRGDGKAATSKREDLLGDQAESDFFILMRAFRFAERSNFNPQRCRDLGINAGAAREAAQLFGQFLRIAEAEGLDVGEHSVEDTAIQRCVLAGFSDQLAMRLDKGTLRCQLVHGRRGVLARESVVHHSPLLVASEVSEIQMKGEVQTLLSLATAVDEQWLQEMFPEDFQTAEECFYDSTQRRVASRTVTRFRDLQLRAAVSDKVSPEQAAALLAAKVLEGACPLVNWDHGVEQWITRVNRLREWMPELELPAIDQAAREEMIQQLCYGATTYKEIKERQVWGAVKAWLSKSQQDMIDKFAPERIELPSGKRWKIVYDEKAAPTIAARIQELYGVDSNLTVAAGRVPLLIQVLAPNMRPVQVTQSLTTFWREAYPKLKQELQRKYPKHEWR